MPTLENLQQEWTKYRQRLEREIRVLVVHDEPSARKELDQMLFRCRISARAVDSLKGVEDLVARDHYSLVLVASHLYLMQNLTLVRSLARSLPDVDVIPIARDLTVDLVRDAIELGVHDLITWPVSDKEQACERIRGTVRANVNRRMRAYVLQRLREELARADEETRKQVTDALERRLDRFKGWIGAFDHVLVEEGEDAELRRLSENLLVVGMCVETADLQEDAWNKIEERAPHLAVLSKVKGTDLVTQVERLRRIDPLAELVVVAREPSPREALEALRLGVALYLPWPPDDQSLVVDRIWAVQQRCRRGRLMDALLTALFWESHGVLEHPTSIEEAFDGFRSLSGMERKMPAEVAASATTDPVVVLEDVLDNILDGGDPQELVRDEPTDDSDSSSDHERRAHLRVQESQFVRFRLEGANTATLAYIGDLSEGGVFVRTTQLQSTGVQLTVDVNLEHEGLGYLLRCRAEVAWVARDTSRVPYGPGFGVRFIDPPEDVKVLLKRIVRSRLPSPL